MTSTESTPEIEAGSGKTRKPLTVEQREQKNRHDRERRAAQAQAKDQPAPDTGPALTQDQQDQPYQHQMSDMLNTLSKARYARVTADRERVAREKHN